MQSPFIVELTEQNFRETLESSVNTPVLIQFWANAQPESAQIIPELQTLTQQYNGAFKLALLNCEQQPTLASQFGIQSLPTIALFINGQAVDGMGGPQPLAAITEMLTKHLPSQEELQLKQANELIQSEQYAEALTILLSLPDAYQNNGEVKLLIANCFIETQQFTQAEALLETLPLEYKNSDYKSLMAKLELQQQAENSPELQALELKWLENKDDYHIACELAAQYHQVARDEDALALLWQILQKDLSAHDNEVKKSFMDILSALGQGNPLAGKYRRQLYSILY